MSCRTFGIALGLVLPAALGVWVTPLVSSTSLSPLVSSGPLSVLAPRTAEASVSVAVTLEQLVESSAFVVVARAEEQRSQWEEIGGSRRIVTYTRLSVGQTVTGEPGKDVWVRTLGGVVDRVGQQVSGEATLKTGTESLLFLRRASGGMVVVSAMAQGHFPLVRKADGEVRLGSSPDVGEVLERPGPSIAARELLVGQPLGEAVKAIQVARKAVDAKR
ncbi:hypothetical protein [Chondromyces apiculatus]|uniref:Uncharacterized protein n=1 Tax=Chondromyces apiculatus DSM 436 TaxID=1192034 RepID=A0A017T3Z7_9BACT|nr:hypothetical protein [Chondromyces apiculatus]EYF03717.1 Hypothetical protein CAP_5328 [Chondromyces apiculatus DSM 436]